MGEAMVIVPTGPNEPELCTEATEFPEEWKRYGPMDLIMLSLLSDFLILEYIFPTSFFLINCLPTL